MQVTEEAVYDPKYEFNAPMYRDFTVDSDPEDGDSWFGQFSVQRARLCGRRARPASGVLQESSQSLTQSYRTHERAVGWWNQAAAAPGAAAAVHHSHTVCSKAVLPLMAGGKGCAR